MALNTGRPFYDSTIQCVATATVTAGFTIACANPFRGEIRAIYLTAADGGALGGSPATMTVSVNNSSIGTMSFATASAGFASGGDTSFSPRAFVKAGDVIKVVLATNLTNANNGQVTMVIRQRTA